jgi:hypothetical protein
MEFPKPRRKTYKYFENFDIIKYKGEWFVRFPQERQYVYFGDERATKFEEAVTKECNAARNAAIPYYVDEFKHPIAMFPVPVDLRAVAVETATKLLAEG